MLRLLPGWPLLVLLGLAVAVVPRWRGPARGPLGAGGLLALLLLPPLVHGALFPQGLLVHTYWLFGLPAGLGAAGALALRPLGRRLPAALAGAAAVASLTLVPTDRLLPDEPSEIPALVGGLLAEVTAPGELVLTNYDVNPLLADAEGDAYVSRLLEVTWASDRRVRGIGSPAVTTPDEPHADLVALLAALERCPDARWFLLLPEPLVTATPSDALRAALEDRASAPPTRVYEQPPVWLFRLGP